MQIEKGPSVPVHIVLVIPASNATSERAFDAIWLVTIHIGPTTSQNHIMQANNATSERGFSAMWDLLTHTKGSLWAWNKYLCSLALLVIPASNATSERVFKCSEAYKDILQDHNEPMQAPTQDLGLHSKSSWSSKQTRKAISEKAFCGSAMRLVKTY